MVADLVKQVVTTSAKHLPESIGNVMTSFAESNLRRSPAKYYSASALK